MRCYRWKYYTSWILWVSQSAVILARLFVERKAVLEGVFDVDYDLIPGCGELSVMEILTSIVQYSVIMIAVAILFTSRFCFWGCALRIHFVLGRLMFMLEIRCAAARCGFQVVPKLLSKYLLVKGLFER
jgi:hypothetical protein